ncbi:HEAT repeat domain-containing protein [Pyxidicoccus fallax]|uniref:HEAT repeat domain-containing protein n=1 Tax=Pyxidicoccus fallax TaxID=394095 RepID=A0A848LXC5_9BACT|nr:HEAT repeat domain-containing protein [Pyxidicoccus fallax]NMO22271.1 HEAT repeat domain-containing protein [Pyxidicoccus fallax]NPC84066.1 HEAT repeat domain-containing protein [Pyxidicoccus fallax]
MAPLRRALAVLLLATGCIPSPYDRAARTDTVEAYRDFLREYPKHPDVDAAEARLEELEFEEAKRLHTVIAYKRFLEAYPEAAQARTAKTLLEGLRFNAAKESGTVAAWRQFLQEHPDGAQREEAKRLLGEAEAHELATTDDPQRLTEYLRASPDDPRRQEVEARLDGQAFAQAKAAGASKLFAYLKDFPAGAHREEVRVQLLELEVEGLLVSGLVEEAEAKVKGHPLGSKLTRFPERLARARAERAALARPEPVARAAHVAHYLRDLDDLKRALTAMDPLDRWQAAEELGQHVSVRTIDPLLDALRSARNPLIRQHALESLRTVLSALPRPVAEYEVASRLDALRERASSAEMYLTVAVLLDLSGQLALASTEYQRVVEGGAMDPVVLRRWVQIREERRQNFSAAVAARQLALWALDVARDETVTPEGQVPLASARQLCAAAVNARFAAEAIARARSVATEFPEDLAEFERRAVEAKRLSEARLADAELLLRQQTPGVRTCADQAVRERLDGAVKERTAALEAVGSKLPQQVGRMLLELARERDPSPQVRAAASDRLTALKPVP